MRDCTSLHLSQGSQFEVGLVFWPGGLEEQWGNVTNGLQPCNPDVMANLVGVGCQLFKQPTALHRVVTRMQAAPQRCVHLQTAQGAMFAAYNVRADRLTMLKTTLPEELILTSKSPSTAPKVISMVAFRQVQALHAAADLQQLLLHLLLHLLTKQLQSWYAEENLQF